MTWEPEVEELDRRAKLAEAMGGEERIGNQHDRGKLTVRERIDLLFDKDTFHERGKHSGAGAYNEAGELVDFFPSGYVLGVGEVNGRRVVAGGGDFTARPASGSDGAKISGGRPASKGGHDE